MNAPFANIFLAIQQRIQSQVADIKHIDQDLGQLKTEKGTRPAVSWPCVLIDFEHFEFQSMGDNAQTAQGTVVLRLGFAPFSPSAQGTPDAYKEKALSYYDIEWALHQAMQGWAPGDAYGKLTRISTTTQHRSDTLRVREIRYRIAFQDYDTKPAVQYVPAEKIMNLTFNKQ